MKRDFQSIKATVVSGFWVVVPILVVTLLFSELYDLLMVITEPLVEQLPFRPPLSQFIAFVLAVAEAFLVCLAVGTASRTSWGSRGLDWVEETVLSHLPLYGMLKNLTGHFLGKAGMQFTPAEVDLFGAESRTIGLVVEELPGDRIAVFIPAAPAATVGQVHILPRARIRILDTKLGTVINSITQWGVGTSELYKEP